MTKRDAGRSTTDSFTLPQAAELIGLSSAELAEFIREAGLEPKGPEAEWRLDAADVLALKAEREKRASRNLSELQKLEGVVPEQ